jgi:hypothetical protein
LRYTLDSLTLFPNAGLDPIDEGAPGVALVEGSPCFDGHFDGAPILPGIAHLALALSACARESGRARVLIGLRNVRFSRTLGPGDEVEVVLAAGHLPHSIRFELRCRGAHASSGLLLFGPEGDRRSD